MADATKTTRARFLDPKVIARISQLDLRARHDRRGVPLRACTRARSTASRSSSSSTASTSPATTSAASTGRCGSDPTSSSSSSTRPRPTCASYVVVDASESMMYGVDGTARPGTLYKYDYAATAAACLVVPHHQAAGLVRAHHLRRGRAAGRSRRAARTLHMDAVTKALHVSKPRAKTDILKIIRRVAETMPTRGLVMIFSDLLCDREPLFKGLEMLRHRRHDVMVFHVLDDDELLFPFAGMTKFEGLEELPRPAVRPAGAPRRLPRSAGGVPRRGAPRLHPDRHRLQPDPHQRLPGRGAVAVPVRSGCRSGPTPVRQ